MSRYAHPSYLHPARQGARIAEHLIERHRAVAADLGISTDFAGAARVMFHEWDAGTWAMVARDAGLVCDGVSTGAQALAHLEVSAQTEDVR